MCSGAEPAAAGAAKGAADVGLAAAATEGGATVTSLAAANAAAAAGGDAIGTLIAGNAATWGVGVAPEIAAAAAPYLAGATAGLSAAGGAGFGMNPATIASGASAVNAGVGLLTAAGAKKGAPAAPSLSQPIVMPTPDDAAAKRARSAMMSTLSQRRGRASTILSNPTSTELLGN